MKQCNFIVKFKTVILESIPDARNPNTKRCLPPSKWETAKRCFATPTWHEATYLSCEISNCHPRVDTRCQESKHQKVSAAIYRNGGAALDVWLLLLFLRTACHIQWFYLFHLCSSLTSCTSQHVSQDTTLLSALPPTKIRIKFLSLFWFFFLLKYNAFCRRLLQCQLSSKNHFTLNTKLSLEFANHLDLIYNAMICCCFSQHRSTTFTQDTIRQTTTRHCLSIHIISSSSLAYVVTFHSTFIFFCF